MRITHLQPLRAHHCPLVDVAADRNNDDDADGSAKANGDDCSRCSANVHREDVTCATEVYYERKKQDTPVKVMGTTSPVLKICWSISALILILGYLPF